jgi:hypothetical protein
MYRFGGRLFAETLPRVVAPTLVDEFSRAKPDLVVYECCDIGAAGRRRARRPGDPYGVGAATDMFRDWHRAVVADQRGLWRGQEPSDLAAYPAGYPTRPRCTANFPCRPTGSRCARRRGRSRPTCRPH